MSCDLNRKCEELEGYSYFMLSTDKKPQDVAIRTIYDRFRTTTRQNSIGRSPCLGYITSNILSVLFISYSFVSGVNNIFNTFCVVVYARIDILIAL